MAETYIQWVIKVVKHFSYNKKFCPLGFICPCPWAIYMYKIVYLLSWSFAPDQLMQWPVVCRPSLAFHIFDISSRTISWIELKLSRRHCGNMEIQNCENRSIPISKMAALAAILKSFKRQLLPNPKSDYAETWWEASQWHRDSKLLKLFCSVSKMATRDGHLEILQTTSP